MKPVNRFFPTTLFFSLCAFALAGPAPAAEHGPAMAPAAKMELFNGQDLKGWRVVARTNEDASQTWTVTNGVIHCSGKPVDYLRTEKDYREYKLTVEWRFVKVAARADNTGVLVHMQMPDAVWPACVQYQGKATRQGDLIFMSGAESKEHLGKGANDAVPMTGEANEKPVGEWNTGEIVCAGNTVKVFTNGKLMNEATECTVTSGGIGFQSEGGEFEVRKVSIEPLGKP